MDVRRNPWFAIAALCWMTAARVSADGTWTMAPPNPTNGGQAFGLWVLTDGTVLSHGANLNDWVILTPDKMGSYANGTWKKVASGPQARGGATQHMLKDGRFFQAGGEYVNGPACTPDLCKGAEIYDPVANIWKVAASGLYEIADTGSANLADGRLLYSTRNSKKIQIYDPTTDKWSDGGTFALANGDENSWAALQNGGILAVGYKSDGAAIYDPDTGKWIRTGPVPSGFATGDTGGISLMFDGRVLVYGFGQMYIYTPGPTGSDPGTWALGPKSLMGLQAEDEFSNTLPNGKVWGGMVEKTYGPGVALQEFDPVTNTVSSAKPPPDKGNPYPIGYANLPNGQVLATCERNDWIYTPDTEPQDDWRPTVTSVTYNGSDKTYTLTGTQLTGLINGSDEGDDMANAQNYPIVWLRNGKGEVFYCRSFNFSSMVPSKGPKPQTCQFTTPKDMPEGEYELFVSAVGVKSKDAYPFKTGDGGPTRDPGQPMQPDQGAAGTPSAAGAGGASAGPMAKGDVPLGGKGSTVGVAIGQAAAGTPATAAGGAGKSAASGAEAGGSAATARPESPSPAATDKSGCGCRIAASGSASANGAWASLALLGVAAVRVRRRSRRGVQA